MVFRPELELESFSVVSPGESERESGEWLRAEKGKLGIQGSAYIGRRRSIRKEARVDAVAASSSGVACMQLGMGSGYGGVTPSGG